MPNYYTPPGKNDTQGFFELTKYVSSVTDGLLFPIILMVIWVVVFIATKQFSSSRAFTYAAFICTVLAIPLAVFEMLNPRYMYLFIVLLAAGAVWLKLEGGGKPF